MREIRDQWPTGWHNDGTEPSPTRGCNKRESHSKMRMSNSNEKGGPSDVWQLYIVMGVT